MKYSRLAIVLLVSSAAVYAQEREVPKDSTRVSIPGCARGRSFIVGERPDEPVRSDIKPGQRFRLSGPGKLLDEIKKQERNMVEVTGLVRLAQLRPGGVSIGGVRIGGGPPRDPVGGAGRDVGYNEAILDLESWRPLPESCPSR